MAHGRSIANRGTHDRGSRRTIGGEMMQRTRVVQEVGEAEFHRWGRQESFEVQKLDPDTTGTDRMFELPSIIDLVDGSAADEIGAAVTGNIQIKATECDARYARAKLDNWKRFVDSPLPCFFVLVRLDRDLTPTGAVLLHVGETVGATVLERLRKTPANTPLYEKKLSIPWSQGIVLESPFASSFVREVRRIVGDPDAYSSQKNKWRSETGYDSHSTRITFNAGVDDMLAHARGEILELDAAIVEHSTVRFGISRPGQMPTGPVKLRVDFSKEVRLRFACDSNEVGFDAALYHVASVVEPNELPSEVGVWRVESGPLALLMKRSGQLDMSVALDVDHSVRSWGRIGRALAFLSASGAKVEIVTPEDETAWTGNLEPSDAMREMARLGQLLSDLWRLAESARVSGSSKFPASQAAIQESRIVLTSALTDGESITLRGRLDEPMQVGPNGASIGALFVSTVRFADEVVLASRAYESVVVARGDRTSVQEFDFAFEPAGELTLKVLQADEEIGATIQQQVEAMALRLEPRYEALLVDPGRFSVPCVVGAAETG